MPFYTTHSLLRVFSLALLALIFFFSLLQISCKTVSHTPSARVAAAPGESCQSGGYTTCIAPYQGKHLVCAKNNQAVLCASCSSDRGSFPAEHNAEYNASTGFYHDYATNCEAAPKPVVSPTAPPAPSPSNSNTMVFGFNIHDVQQHHFYEQRLGDGPGQLSYKEPGKSAYVLHRAISDHSNFMDGVNRAIEIASAKGDLLIIRFDYRDGSTVPSPLDSEVNRQAFYQKVDSLLAHPGIAYVQVGNEPNLDYECQNLPAHCQPNVYVPVLQRYKGHGKFISAPWGPTEHLALSKPWEWALGALSGNCPVNIGIHAYPALGDGDRAKTTAMQFIAMNLKYIWEAGCRNSNIFITELNGNMGGDKHEWVAALKAARSGIDWINAKMGSQRIKAALIFTLGQEGVSDHQDQMSRFYLAINDRGPDAIYTAKNCGSWGLRRDECLDQEIHEDFSRAWDECINDLNPAGSLLFCPFH